jgi:serine/threonine protein kinase/formylglycine-generating enzyme required for sulfatase activity
MSQPPRSADRPEASPADAVPSQVADLACARLLGASPGEQDAVLADLCRQHAEHAVGLRHLHAEMRRAERMLEDTFARDGDPTEIARFRVVRRLGEGAFGVVYLCAEEAPFQRQVAIKVLRPGAGSRQTLARFEGERQVLARMGHPAIANVFEAGELADGRPYFVMEYVEGAPITAYSDRHRLTVAERLALFLALCDGVQHAHQKGVIHRDLKPSNVLVRDLQGKPQPKIIDFGLAKVMHRADAGGADLTEAGGVVGTPGYMSPEQGEGKQEDVDIRSDVFSLGVILYVLLTGEMPWRRGESSADGAPLRPSVRLASESKQSSEAAVQRASEPRRLQSQLRGDLDWITLRALERERDRRYQTVQELAEDLRRHLRFEPVLAGPPSTVYRLRKLARRYRVQVVAAAAVLLSLLLGLYGTARYASRAHDNLERFEILAIGSRLALARARADDLYPPWPDRLDHYDRWLEDHGRPMSSEVSRLRQALEEVRAHALPYTAEDRALDLQRHPVTAEVERRRATIVYLQTLLDRSGVPGGEQTRKMLAGRRDELAAGLPKLEQEQQERRIWRFASGSQQFLHDTMVQLADELRAFCEGEHAPVRVLAAQRQEIVDDLAELERQRSDWERVAAEIAGDPRYGGLRLTPQFGLVPLGPDPDSGLQEFYHPRSGPRGGETPKRAAGGKLDLGIKSGIVFVLVPGGRAILGAQTSDPSAPNYNPNARTGESPVHEATLGPFFLGKHEITQSQWWYLTDTVPSYFHDHTVSQSGRQITDRHPVENVTWQECRRGLMRRGLDLPTEAQWEFACRAGTTSIWSTGNDEDQVLSFAHVVRDVSEPIGLRSLEAPGPSQKVHASVGSLPANPFGLHDMVGNVAEWCRDSFSSLAYVLTPRAGDGLRPVPEMQNRVVRGGSFEDGPWDGASSSRYPVSHNTRARYVGARAARCVQAEADGR